MKAGTTPSESISGTFAALTASLQSDAAQRICVTGIGRRERRMIAGIASASTSRTALPGVSITAKYVSRPFTSRTSSWSRVTLFLRQKPSTA